MEKKKGMLPKAIGIIMIIAGGLGFFFWLILLVLGVLLSGGGHPDYAHENTVALEYAIPVGLGVIGAVFSLITGISIVGKKRTVKVLAIATAILYLPAIVLLTMMYWYFASIPALLFGFAPPAIYLVNSFGRAKDEQSIS